MMAVDRERAIKQTHKEDKKRWRKLSERKNYWLGGKEREREGAEGKRASDIKKDQEKEKVSAKLKKTKDGRSERTAEDRKSCDGAFCSYGRHATWK